MDGLLQSFLTVSLVAIVVIAFFTVLYLWRRVKREPPLTEDEEKLLKQISSTLPNEWAIKGDVRISVHDVEQIIDDLTDVQNGLEENSREYLGFYLSNVAPTKSHILGAVRLSYAFEILVYGKEVHDEQYLGYLDTLAHGISDEAKFRRINEIHCRLSAGETVNVDDREEYAGYSASLDESKRKNRELHSRWMEAIRTMDCDDVEEHFLHKICYMYAGLRYIRVVPSYWKSVVIPWVLGGD